MPLVRFELRNEFALGKPELYTDVIEQEEEPKAVLDAVAVSGLVGILRQLGDLAEFAAEVFHGLQEEVVTTASKSRKLIARVQHLEAKLPPVEKAVLAQTSHIHFAYTAGCEWHTRIWNERNHFINDDLPRFIMDSYEECRNPPKLHLLDKFDVGGPGSCLKRYSDPSYFKRVSGSLGESNSECLRQDGKSHKIKKKRPSRKNKEISRATSLLNRSGRMQFTASINDHTYPQRTSELDTTLKPDRGRHSYSFDSISESRHNEYVSRLSSKLQPEVQEYRESSSSRSMHQHDEADSISSCQETGMGDEYFSHVTLPEPSALSPSSVTWEEKTEIMEPLQYIIDEVPDIFCTDSEIHLQEKVDANLPKVDKIDIVQDDVLKLKSSEIQCTNPELHLQKKSANPENVDHSDTRNDDAHTFTTVSGKYENDDVESDQDDFMDALNTIESESENELDCQSISKVSRYSSGINDKVTEESIKEHMLHCPDNHPSSMEPNIRSHVLVDSVTHKNEGHSPDNYPSNMESNGGSHILSDGDSPEHPCNDEDVGHSLDQQPSDSQSNTGTQVLVDEDDNENVVHIPHHHAFDMESSGGSHTLADRDGHEHLYADEQVIHSPEYHMESTGGYHIVHTDAYVQMENSPKHYLSNTELDIRSCASTQKDAQSPEHHTDNVEPDALCHSCSDGDFLLGISDLVPSSYSLPYSVPSYYKLPNSTAPSFDLSIPVYSSGDFPNTVPFSYGFPNSGSSSCDLPNSVSSQSYSKDNMSQIAEKSSDLVKSSGLESCESSSVPDDTGYPGNTNAPYSESRISNLPEALGDDNKTRICDSEETVSASKSCQAVTFWTNGGLLGLQPSKPPDFAVMKSTNQDSLDNSKEERYGTLSENHMSKFDGRRGSVATTGENGRTLRNSSVFASSEVCSEDQTNDTNFKEDLHSDRLADSSSTLTKSGQICTNSYADDQMNGPHVTSEWTLGTEAALAPGINSLSSDTNQEMDWKSSQSFGLGQRLLLSGFRRKFPPVHNDTSELLRIVQDRMPEQCSKQQNLEYHTTPDRPYREPFNCKSIQRSPSSPPVEHMKIFFRPVNSSETSSLKLKIIDGTDCHETGNTFSSFQLVPERTAPLHDIGSDSDDDTFCPSPYMSDEDVDSSHPSDSNSEQWESGENLEDKDQELYNALLRRISSEDSTSGSSELGGMVTNSNQVDGRIANQCRENDMEHAFSSPLLDLPDFSIMSHIVKCTAKNGSDARGLIELQLPRKTAPIPPPLPPAPGQYVSLGTRDNAQQSVSKALRAVDLKVGGSSNSSQSNRNLIEKETNGEASLLGSKIKQEQKFNGQKEADEAANGKGMNEREDFLHQIRTKSFNLRPTVTVKPIVAPVGSTNISVTAILEKANAMRRAVGSDGGEDYDTWSDT